jgi:hypothetical protein
MPGLAFSIACAVLIASSGPQPGRVAGAGGAGSGLTGAGVLASAAGSAPMHHRNLLRLKGRTQRSALTRSYETLSMQLPILRSSDRAGHV